MASESPSIRPGNGAKGNSTMGGSPQFPAGSGVASTPVNGVRTGPSGSLGLPTPKKPWNPLFPERVAPSNPTGPRPQPNQGVTVPGRNGGPPVTIGGSKPGSVQITGPNPAIPKTPGRVATFFGGLRGGGLGGGGLGGMFGIKNK
jgi:hypothetical protein